MDEYFGGIMAKPIGVRIKDNSTGTWGFGRSTITSVSLVADSIYDEVVPEIYTDSAMPVNAKIALGREESDFYAAVGIVGEGPLGAYGTGHKLDGQFHHGYPGQLGLLESLGPDPNPTPFGFDTDNPVERAAGTAFVMLRRADAKGLQLSRLAEHAMEVVVAQGLSGWVWTGAGRALAASADQPGLDRRQHAAAGARACALPMPPPASSSSTFRRRLPLPRSAMSKSTSSLAAEPRPSSSSAA
jgi:hypothetical protein